MIVATQAFYEGRVSLNKEINGYKVHIEFAEQDVPNAVRNVKSKIAEAFRERISQGIICE